MSHLELEVGPRFADVWYNYFDVYYIEIDVTYAEIQLAESIFDVINIKIS